jgi:IPT/TIG domain-containing protein
MTSSRTPAAVKRGERAAPRRADRQYGTIRPAFVYVLAALLAIVAAEALRWDRDAAARSPRHPARHQLRRAPAARSDDAGFATPLVPSVPTAAAAGPGNPAAGDATADAAEEQEEDPTAGIAPEDWKMPPPPNPDSSARPAIDDVWPRKGPDSGGQTVQIRGKHLQPVYVLFGRSPAQIVGVDDSSGDVTLTVLAPRRTGPAKDWIVVTNRDGSNATAQFEYYR